MSSHSLVFLQSQQFLLFNVVARNIADRSAIKYAPYDFETSRSSPTLHIIFDAYSVLPCISKLSGYRE